jgi:hypothetical protein
MSTKHSEVKKLNSNVMIFCSIILATLFIFSFSASCQTLEKVAVLYFTDHSGFDSGGVFSIWPLNVIFGTGQKREKWDLPSGFRDMLNEKLTKIGYNVIESSRIDEVLRETKNGNMEELAGKLNADIIIVGDIKKFEQHRARVSSQGATKVASGDYMTMGAMGGVGGFFYSSTVNTRMIIYDSSGEEIENSDFNSKKDLQDFYMGVGPMTYHKGDTKNDENDSKQKEPVVDYKKLDNMKFGSDEFKNDTLFGLATTDVMDKIVAKLGENLRPSDLVKIQGKIIYVGTGDRLKENEVYINLGASDGIRPGVRFGVYVEELKLTDPDSGKELGTAPEEKIGSVKITKIEADHLSIAEIVEKTKDIGRGNIVKQE